MRRCFFIFFLISSAFSGTCDHPIVSASVVAPFSYVDANGQLTGSAIDNGLSILKPVFPDLTLIRAAPHNRTFTEFKNGQIDILLLELFSKEQLEVASFSIPIGTINWAIMTRSDRPFSYTGIESLNGLRGAYLISSPLPDIYKEYLENNPNVQVVAQPLAMINMLELERIDFLVTLDKSIAFIFAHNPALKAEDFTLHEQSFVPTSIHMAVSNRSPCLDKIELINENIRLFDAANRRSLERPLME